MDGRRTSDSNINIGIQFSHLFWINVDRTRCWSHHPQWDNLLEGQGDRVHVGCWLTHRLVVASSPKSHDSPLVMMFAQETALFLPNVPPKFSNNLDTLRNLYLTNDIHKSTMLMMINTNEGWWGEWSLSETGITPCGAFWSECDPDLFSYFAT